ncbi:hypothetical protein JCGZ_03228 [Jatropha curcas]|uniref:Uncharacterized protein n=1 Tax=Jatropha curcas TaxID=180498 RepID=A0A067L1J0_JATCU|nr:hypothetical protein JCGZ_03228 [Jatropha curcas]
MSPLKGITRPSKSPIVELGALLAKRTSGFDPNAYKLLAKAYVSTDVAKLTTDFKNGGGEQSSTRFRKVWKEKNTADQKSKVGQGYQASAPLHLEIRKETSNYISATEIEEAKSEVLRASIFSRLSYFGL